MSLPNPPWRQPHVYAFWPLTTPPALSLTPWILPSALYSSNNMQVPGTRLHSSPGSSNAERKYSAFDRELMAIVAGIKHFHHHVEG